MPRQTLLAAAILFLSYSMAWTSPLPNNIAVEIENAKKTCKTGQAEVTDAIVRRLDVNGDGVQDYVLDFDEFTCDGITTFCGTGGCRQIVFASIGSRTFAKVFDDQVVNINYRRLDGVPAMFVSVHHSECDAKEANVCLRVYKWTDGNFALIKSGEATVKEANPNGSDDGPQQPTETPAAPLPAPTLTPKAQEDANADYNVFLNFYLMAKKCSDNGLIFNKEIVDKIEPFVRQKAGPVPPALKDKAWSALQVYYSSVTVREADCGQAMRQMQYSLPPDVLSSGGTSRSPF